MSCRECNGRGVEPCCANPAGICLKCGAERFGVDPVAQEHYDRTGTFLTPTREEQPTAEWDQEYPKDNRFEPWPLQAGERP